MFIVLLSSIVNASNHTKCVLLSNQKCMIHPTLNGLRPNEYSQEFLYYPFSIKLDRSFEICNTLNDLSNKICIPNKTEDLNLSVLEMITGINEPKTLTKDISCECKCKFDRRKCNSSQWWNNDKCQCECKKRYVCEKDYVWNPALCNNENGNNLASIMAKITCDETIDIKETNLTQKV